MNRLNIPVVLSALLIAACGNGETPVAEKTIESAIQGIDTVILLAGLVGDLITKKYPFESILINDKGIRNVIDLCAKNDIPQLIFVSTCSNYGFIKNNDLADEKYVLNPLSLYAKSKVNAEKHILSLEGKSHFLILDY